MGVSIELRKGSRRSKDPDWLLIVAETKLFAHICDKTAPLQMNPPYVHWISHNSCL